ncbi:MAG TPA: carbon-nitrogen hydrolase family protein [Myxococcota bacterium]|nr:carbon-nitrogen hydrolase family protein [Myxococcota bacterium]
MIAAVVQMTSTADLERNLARAGELVGEAAGRGAELVALPENFALMREEDAGAANPHAQDLPGGRVPRFLAELAARHRIVLAGGTFPERIAGDARVLNTSTVFGPEGELLAVYRKIHLFDVDLPGATHRESSRVAAGSELALAKTESCTLGLSVCYDVRFPELYRTLVERGAQVLLVPSAFTVPTGRDHWEVLLRARAIENQCFVVAAAQFGEHNATRRTYGRSLVVDPWGTVLCTASDGEGVALAELDFARQDDVRRRLPALRHRRL